MPERRRAVGRGRHVGLSKKTRGRSMVAATWIGHAWSPRADVSAARPGDRSNHVTADFACARSLDRVLTIRAWRCPGTRCWLG
jgi:hypothetical protein